MSASMLAELDCAGWAVVTPDGVDDKGRLVGGACWRTALFCSTETLAGTLVLSCAATRDVIPLERLERKRMAMIRPVS